MIVISGALVLVALVLLVIGLVSTALGFVYASIAVSVVSFAFLIIGILQRRGEPLPEAATSSSPAPAELPSEVEGVTAIIPAGSRPREAAATGGAASGGAASGASATKAAAAAGGSVLVVAGRPRYHVAGCRYLTGKDAEVVPVEAARADGFAPCGVCRPDEAVAAVISEPVEESPASPEPVTGSAEPIAPTRSPASRGAGKAKAAPVQAATAAAGTRSAATRTARSSASTERTSPGRPKAPRVAPVPAAEARAPQARAPRATPARSSRALADEAPVLPVTSTKRAAAATAARPAPARGVNAKAAGVVVIPDGAKYHRPDCRFVRGAAEAEDRTKAQANRQGYAACGVCKP